MVTNNLIISSSGISCFSLYCHLLWYIKFYCMITGDDSYYCDLPIIVGMITRLVTMDMAHGIWASEAVLFEQESPLRKSEKNHGLLVYPLVN